jgi:hypothetical protein
MKKPVLGFNAEEKQEAVPKKSSCPQITQIFAD